MVRILTAFILIALLAAWNTVQGIGKDIERGSEAIQKSTK